MIPRFARNGLLPPGEHQCDWYEFAARYEGSEDNQRRRRLTLGLAQMLWLLAEAGCHVCYVDGSFVTRERWPRDFDLCYGVDGLDAGRLDRVFLDLGAGRVAQKQRFGGEAFPAEFPFDWNGCSVRDAFVRDRVTGAPKGIVRLDPMAIADELHADIVWRQARLAELARASAGEGL